MSSRTYIFTAGGRTDGWRGETCKKFCSFWGFFWSMFFYLFVWKGKQIAWGLETRLWQVYYHCNGGFDCLLLTILLISKIYKEDRLLPMTQSNSWFILYYIVSGWHELQKSERNGLFNPLFDSHSLVLSDSISGNIWWWKRKKMWKIVLKFVNVQYLEVKN